MLSDEVVRRVRALHFKTRHFANDLFAGLYGSAYKGRGIEFSGVRPYQPGDDTRTIDWKVSARFGHPFVKVFHEERELTVILLLDLSGSLLFGTRKRLKKELMAELAAMLAFLAIKTNDKVGAIFFSSTVEKYIPPKKGAAHVWRLIKEIFAYEPGGSGTNICSSLSYLNRVLKRHAVVFLLSDFLDTDFTKALQVTSKKHDVTLIRVHDPAEEELPGVGLMSLQDLEKEKTLIVNSGSRRLREDWLRSRKEFSDGISDFCKKAGIDLVEVSTGGNVVEPLMRLFRTRNRRI